jgi:hypothetical protein
MDIKIPCWVLKNACALRDGRLELGQGGFLSDSLLFYRLAMQHPGGAMHLAAGLHFPGFPSVIATIWGISDEDAPSDAAAALNHAVLALREDPDVTTDRWATFVHFGI